MDGAEREIRQEQQSRPRALAIRKLCFYFLRTLGEGEGGGGTSLDQLDEKECKVKGGVPFSARRQIDPWVGRTLLARDLRESR